MTEERYAIALDIKREIDRAESAHPRCGHLKALHGHLGRLLEDHRSELTEEQFIALGGGTNKTPPGGGG